MSKSARDKAAEVCRKLGLPVIEDENGVAYQVILKALQEHEHDTKQSCANAASRATIGQTARTTHAACMNAKVE